MPIRTVAFIGQGCLGVLYGNLLAGHPEVRDLYFIADPDRITRYTADRATVNGARTDFSYRTPDEAVPVDLVVFAVKQTGLTEAIRDAKKAVGENTLIISLLNGITSEDEIGAAFGREKVLPVIAQGQDVVKQGPVVTYQRPGELLIGVPEDAPEKTQAVDRLQALFDGTGFPYTRVADIQRRLWSKWMLNVGVNQVVAACEGSYADVQKEGAVRDRMKAAMQEVREVAAEEGLVLTQKDLDDYVALIDTLDPKGMPSMRQDTLAGRKTELESFAGTVIALSDRHGVDIPVNRALYKEIREIENR